MQPVRFDDLWLRDGLRDLLKEELGEHARQIVQFVVGSHDIGKASPIFQMQYRKDDDHWRRIRGVVDESGFYGQIPLGSPLRDFDNKFARRHEQWSAYCIAGGFLSSSDEVRDRWHALAALGHHGYFSLGEHNRIFAAKRKTASKELEESGWLQAQRDLLACVAVACDVDINGMPEEVSPTVTLLLSGLTILADRIASGLLFVEGGAKILARDPDALKLPNQWIACRRDDAVKRVRERFPELTDPPSDDICYATQNRQVAVKSIAPDVDVMIVVGSANSSNSVRLLEVALDAGAGSAHRVDRASELREEWFEGAQTVGVTSGASVPEVLVRDVIAWLKERGLTHVEQVRTETGQRVYEDCHLNRLRAICCFKNAGMTIDEIGRAHV